MDIERLIKDAHSNAVGKGFYECPTCRGIGEVTIQIGSTPENFDQENKECSECKGTGKDQNKNIGELLMLIVSELGEALEAHRKGKFADWNGYKIDYSLLHTLGIMSLELAKKQAFDKYMKGSFEDEIADVFIRLFDLCGYLGVSDLYKMQMSGICYDGNIGHDLFILTDRLKSIYMCSGENSSAESLTYEIRSFYTYALIFAYNNNIDIEKHIEAKMEYNKTRPYKHGKKY